MRNCKPSCWTRCGIGLAILALAASGCISLRPAQPPVGVRLDEPEIRVQRLGAGEPAPAAGYWLSPKAYEALLAKARAN